MLLNRQYTAADIVAGLRMACEDPALACEPVPARLIRELILAEAELASSASSVAYAGCRAHSPTASSAPHGRSRSARKTTCRMPLQ